MRGRSRLTQNVNFVNDSLQAKIHCLRRKSIILGQGLGLTLKYRAKVKARIVKVRVGDI